MRDRAWQTGRQGPARRSCDPHRADRWRLSARRHRAPRPCALRRTEAAAARRWSRAGRAPCRRNRDLHPRYPCIHAGYCEGAKSSGCGLPEADRVASNSPRGVRASLTAALKRDGILRRLYHQGRGIRAHDLDAAPGGGISACEPPDAVVDPNRAVACDDRLFQGEHAAHEGVGTAIEERLIDLSLDAMREAPPQRDRREREHRERDELILP